MFLSDAPLRPRTATYITTEEYTPFLTRKNALSAVSSDSRVGVDINTQLPQREAVKKLDELSRFLCGNTYRKIMVAWNFLEHQVQCALLNFAVLSCVVWCVLCCTVCCAVLCCEYDVLCCAVLCCAVLCCAVLCCAVLYCTVLYYLVSYCIVSYHIISYRVAILFTEMFLLFFF